MLFNPIRLKSPSGQNLEIQLETHVYARSDTARGLGALQGKEAVGIEGVSGLSSIEKTGLLFMYYVSLPFFSLFSIEWHSSKNPTTTQAAVCAAIHQQIDQPKNPTAYQKVCEQQFETEVPELPSLTKVKALEGELDPLQHAALIFLELRFVPLVLVELMGFVALAVRSRQVTQYLFQKCLRNPSVTPIQWPRFWNFARERIGKPCATALNPFAWPRYLWQRSGHSSPQKIVSFLTWDHLEAGVFYFWVTDQIILKRNRTMAHQAHEMLTENEGAQNNMIVVGALHYGIGKILVEKYGYERVN